MVSATAFTGAGRHRAPYWNLRHISQAGVITGLAAAIPAAFMYSLNGRATPPLAPPAPQAVVSAGAAVRPEHILAAHQIRVQTVQVQTTYTVRRHDSLSKIAKAQLGSAKLWPELWWINRHKIHNPMIITAGLSLRLAPLPPARERYAREALAAIPPPPRPAAPTGQAATGSAAVSPPAAAAPVAQAPVAQTSAGAAPGSFQACVIARESGGNPSAVNASSGAGGLYQFLPSTWAALGYSGLPENASVAEQNAAFQKLYAQQGTSPWAPSDGC